MSTLFLAAAARRLGVRLVLTLGLALNVPIPSPAAAQTLDPLADDIELPVRDVAAVEAGRERFGARCTLCHGAKGRGGGKGAPCLSCGRFRHGRKASQLYAHISGGIPGTLMGAFGSSLSQEEILNIIAFLRVYTAERKAAGELD